jgi:hypothetical protein
MMSQSWYKKVGFIREKGKATAREAQWSCPSLSHSCLEI